MGRLHHAHRDIGRKTGLYELMNRLAFQASLAVEGVEKGKKWYDQK